VWFSVGAAINFVPQTGRGRDVRGLFIALWFWVMIAVESRAPRAPIVLVSVGLAGLAASLALFHWASYSIRGRYFSYAFSRDVPEFLHTAGPYAYVRNPFYASYVIGLASAALMHPSVLTLAVVVGAFYYFDMAARFEERKFETSPLRVEYLAYKSRTGRFVPKRFTTVD
jgi:protein-S-isoprenylcysteine O-methyltransferase Ste14